MVRYVPPVAPRRASSTSAREEPRARHHVPRTHARLDVDERRSQLVALGIDLFSTRPYDDVSIDELAREAGISKGLLYHYFPTKRHFYVATVREGARELLERTATPPGMDPLERLRAGLDAYLDYVSRHGPAYESMLRSGIGTDAEVSHIVDETRETFCARLVEGAPVDGSSALVRLAVRGWLGFCEAATIEWLTKRRTVRRASMREMLVQVLLGAVQTAATQP
jgi:AcrR family transcriptional regulator